jgi:protein gp37
MTNIEWTDATWNPVVGCKKVAAGCTHCYAETMAKRLAKMGQKQYAAVVNETGWNGKAVTVPEALDKPLHWRKGRKIFVCSMSDLFHAAVPFEYVAAVYGVMAACPQHTFQVLTKRPSRMLEFFKWLDDHKWRGYNGRDDRLERLSLALYGSGLWKPLDVPYVPYDAPFPLPNVWHGTSIANQKDADKNIPILLKVPSAVRFVSAEPLVGPVDLEAVPLPDAYLTMNGITGVLQPLSEKDTVSDDFKYGQKRAFKLDWVIVGGESGPGARPCNVEWIRSIVEQCKAAGVACFVKQDSGPRAGMKGRIPDDLWLKESPHVS